MVDFECIKNPDKNKRLVAFGRYAGIAGIFDFLRGCGEFYLQRGFQTPFVYLGSSYMYEDYVAMCEALKRVNKGILNGGLPKNQTPIVFGVTGTGRVSSGVIEILEQLPHDYVTPKDLDQYIKDNTGKPEFARKIVICQF